MYLKLLMFVHSLINNWENFLYPLWMAKRFNAVLPNLVCFLIGPWGNLLVLKEKGHSLGVGVSHNKQ